MKTHLENRKICQPLSNIPSEAEFFSNLNLNFTAAFKFQHFVVENKPNLPLTEPDPSSVSSRFRT